MTVTNIAVKEMRELTEVPQDRGAIKTQKIYEVHICMRHFST